MKFCYAVLGVISSFTIISLMKRELVALLELSSCCHVAVSAFVSSFSRILFVYIWLSILYCHIS